VRFLSLFAGIGGFDLGLERAGMQCIGQVENNEFCQRVLAYHWPNVKRMGDIKNVKGTEFGEVDLVCGGVPCQPASTAGKRRGTADDRWLWPEAFRLVRVIQPQWCLFENVRGITSLESGVVFDALFAELESYGYEVQSFCVPACAVDAPHRRDRVWIVGWNSNAMRCDWDGWEIKTVQNCNSNTNGICENVAHAEIGAERAGLCASEPGRIGRGRFGNGSGADDVADNAKLSDGENITEKIQRQIQQSGISIITGNVSNTKKLRLQGVGSSREQVSETHERSGVSLWDSSDRAIWLPEPTVGRVANGVPGRVDRLRSLGNAVVPQVVEIFGRVIMEASRKK